jgi:hypothetical protein
MNPFYIQKVLDAVAGNVKNASGLRNDTPLAQTQKDTGAELLHVWQ